MKRWIALAAPVAGLLIVIAASSLVRIASGEMGASRSGWLAPGWHARRPFSKITRIPTDGTLELGPVEAVTPTGATQSFSVHLRYSLDERGGDPSIAREAASAGGSLAGALATSLRETITAALRTAPGAIPRHGSAADAIGSSLAAQLDQLGIGVSNLEWRRSGGAMGAPIAALPPPHRRKILLIGLDAADWQIIDPLIARGRLPNLARLIRTGSRAPLRSYDPMISPLIWTTIATGVGPDVHGIADFLVDDSSTGGRIPITSRFRRVKALWNILSEAHLSSGFVGWWASYPAEPVDGLLVTDLMGFSLLSPEPDPSNPRAGITYPGTYSAEIRPRMILPDQVQYEEITRIIRASREEYEKSLVFKPADPAQAGGARAVQDPVWLVRRALAMTRNYETIALDLLSRNLDLVGVYFEGIDLIGHRFQHCLPPHIPLCPEDDYGKFKDAVTAFYEYQDEVVGKLVEAAPGRTVVVVSDHGFRNGADRPADYLPYTTGQPVEWHREYGILILSGPGVRAGARIEKASVYDIAPTLLYLAGLPASEEMPGRVVTEGLDPAELASNPPRRIPSYEEVGEARSLPQIASSPEAQREMIESLQALGYVGPLPGSTSPQQVGETGAAKHLGESASDPQTTRVTYHRNMATYYMKSGRYQEAEAELLIANKIQPLPKSFELLSEIRAANGDVAGAVDFLEQGLRTFPDMEQDAILWMVDLHIQQGRSDLAREVLSRWGPRLTRTALLDTCEGKIAAFEADPDRAIARFLVALGKEPALSQAALAAAPLLDARGRLAELEPPITRALASEKRLDEYQNLLGLIRLEARRPVEAMSAIGLALDVDPANPRFLDNFASAALSAGQPQLALERYRTAVQDPRATALVWAGYGRFLGSTHHPSEAAQAFAKAHDLGDRSPALYLGYATSLFESGHRDRSREVLQEGLQAHPSDPSLQALSRRLP